jgi:succinate dehydrogenase flavin-adding protein (antitoxin of CptAB toxin-antitoxin module)
MKILLVDDDVSQNKILEDAVEIFNSSSDVKVILDIAITYEDGLSKIKFNNNYDGAIIDLRLVPNDQEGLGNRLLKEIISNLRFPIRVITTHKGDLEPELQIENILFKCRGRGEEEYDFVLNEFKKIYSTGITSILNNQGQIQSNITKVFWKHISEILPEFINYKESTPNWDGEKVLLRYISSHILEYLEISIDNNLEPVHNIEFYIKPPVKEKIFTGDVLKLNDINAVGIILTPACDLATDKKRINPKAEFVTVAIIESYESVTNGKNSGDVRKLCSNSLDLKYHFLPKTILFSGGFVNFQNILSIPIGDFVNKDKIEVECVITSPFRKDIISRFASYFSRQGQPSIE